MKKSYITDTLTSVFIQQVVKIGAKGIEIYEGFFIEKNRRALAFKVLFENFFEMVLKYRK